MHGTLEEEVYMALPPGFFLSPKLHARYPKQLLVCKLLKSLYGLRQAPRRWFLVLSSALINFGFTQIVSESSLFYFQKGSAVALLLMYVDDMVLTGNDTSLLEVVVTFLGGHFKIKDLGNLKYFLGLELARSDKEIYVNQRKYTLDIIKDTGLWDAKPSCIPIKQHHTLQVNDASPFFTDVATYRRLIGV